jgi:FtsP/CotA-like multicopper oxidase with cupredoxin domain
MLPLTRREALKVGGLGVVGLAGSALLPWGGTSVRARGGSELSSRNRPLPFRTRFLEPPDLKPRRTTRDPDGVLVDHFEVIELPGRVHILPGGLATTVWGYNGSVPGPTLNVHQGRRAVLRVRNHLPDRHPTLGYEFTTSTHLHGSASLPQFDGYASDLTPPGFYKPYRYPNFQGARTLWYHDHAVHHTAQNAYSGMAAQYHMHDLDEERLLPQGVFDVAVTVRDALFRSDGELDFDDSSTSQLNGDVILVNGRPWPVMRVKRRVYRFRFLNASVSRSYRFALDTADPVTVVATDGGLMPMAQTVESWRHGPAERYEVLVDFRGYRSGQRVILRNLSNDNNVDFDHTDVVMAFDVTDADFERSDPTWNRIPERLVDSDVMRLRPPMATRARRLVFERKHGQWTINGRTWTDVIASDFTQVIADPGLNDVEIWELENKSGGWFHPVHIHLVDFQILSRNGQPPFDFERGPKDVAYVGENEAVRLIMRFGPHRGRYMVHCHNLVHEDHDMMHQFGVDYRPDRPDPNDPILAAPPLVDNLPGRRSAGSSRRG